MSDGTTISTVDGGERRRFWVAFALVALLYALTLNNQWAIRPDAATYLGVGRSLAEGHGLRFNDRPLWALPPLIPALVAVCRMLVGDNYWLINVVMRLFAVGTVLVGYALVWRLAEGWPDRLRRDVALGVMLLVGVSARFFCDAMPVLTDVPFTFWLMLGLYAFVRGRTGHWAWLAAGSIVMLLAIATRYVGAVIFAAMILAILIDWRPGYFKRALAALVGPALLVAAGILLLVSGRGPKALSDMPGLLSFPLEMWNALLFGQKAAEVAGTLAAVPKAVTEALVDQELQWINLVPTALMGTGFIVAFCRKNRIVWVPVFLFVLFLAMLGPAAVSPRYLLPLLPLLAYLLLSGVRSVATWVATFRSGKREEDGRGVRVVLAATVILCLAISLPKDVREVYWMRYPQFYKAYEKGRWQDWLDASAHLRERGRPGDVVGTTEISVVHYLTGLTCYTDVFLLDLTNPHGWQYGFANLTIFPPASFADMVAWSNIRFLVLPTDIPTPPGQPRWSDHVEEEIREDGVFGPPRRFGRLVVYERLPGVAEEKAP